MERQEGNAGLWLIISCPEKVRGKWSAALIRKETGDVEKVWKDLKDCFLEEAVNVCEETRGILLDKTRRGGGTRRLRPW